MGGDPLTWELVVSTCCIYSIFPATLQGSLPGPAGLVQLVSDKSQDSHTGLVTLLSGPCGLSCLPAAL